MTGSTLTVYYSIDPATFTYIRHALDEFILNHKADMVLKVPNKQDWHEAVIQKKQTKYMLFNRHIPLFILLKTSIEGKDIEVSTFQNESLPASDTRLLLHKMYNSMYSTVIQNAWSQAFYCPSN